jgi:hypothetical protein
MPEPDASRQRRPHTALVASAVAAGVVLLGVAGCSGGVSDTASSGGSSSSRSAVAGSSGGNAMSQAGADTAGSAGGALEPAKQASAPGSSTSDPVLVGRALIKTAAVSLRSSDVSSVRAKIDQLVTRDGGYIASEDTSTDKAGLEVSSHIEIAVPAGDFNQALDEVSTFGKAVSTSSSSQDVTARVVDVDSRVKSAHDSIAQLRLLFSRATKLGDVIALENELSQREADLEALQSEQRDLAAHTNMSTISVDVSSSATTVPAHHDKTAGFLAGIRQGWHDMVTFIVAFSHGVGLVLPLGSLALLAALAVWVGVRRLTPWRRPRTSE